jgi:hypothetical protein
MSSSAALIILLLGATATAGAPTTLYVDCARGSDAAPGTAAAPFASLARAQAAVRAALPAPPPGITVYLQGDCTPRDASGRFTNATLLVLTAADSGSSEQAPVTWAAWPGATAAPRLLGGVAVPASAWAPAPAPAAAGTLVADLGAAGLDVAKFGFGALSAGGLGSCTDTAMEFFYAGQPQVLARYPNVNPDGSWPWLEIVKVEDKEHVFFINGTAAEHALRWPTATSPGASAWVHGFWSYDWVSGLGAVGGRAGALPPPLPLRAQSPSPALSSHSHARVHTHTPLRRRTLTARCRAWPATARAARS